VPLPLADPKIELAPPPSYIYSQLLDCRRDKVKLAHGTKIYPHVITLVTYGFEFSDEMIYVFLEFNETIYVIESSGLSMLID